MMEKSVKKYLPIKNVKRTIIFTLLLCNVFAQRSVSQELRKRILPSSAIAIQYAGSTGFLTVGYFRGTQNEKIQAGVLYGNTPVVFGGSLHSLSLKAFYNPFKINITKRLYLEPLQAGAFFCQNFGRNLEVAWPSYYPKGYYWWPASLRSHIFFSSAISIRTNKPAWVDHITYYFEANTNDLYIASYLWKSNHRSLSPYDLIFFGMGLRFYLKRA